MHKRLQKLRKCVIFFKFPVFPILLIIYTLYDWLQNKRQDAKIYIPNIPNCINLWSLIPDYSNLHNSFYLCHIFLTPVIIIHNWLINVILLLNNLIAFSSINSYLLLWSIFKGCKWDHVTIFFPLFILFVPTLHRAYGSFPLYSSVLSNLFSSLIRIYYLIECFTYQSISIELFCEIQLPLHIHVIILISKPKKCYE